MGYYINPPDETKEAFLAREGTPTTPNLPADDGVALICLVDNYGVFSAAGIVYDAAELADFTDRNDARSRSWYLVPKTALPAVTADLPTRWEHPSEAKAG